MAISNQNENNIPQTDLEEEMEYDAPPMSMMHHPYLGMLGMNEGPAAEEGTEAIAGTSLPENSKIAEIEAVIAALKTVFDPEIPVNIYDLGLIYEHKIDAQGDCDILMTLTAPACPVAGEMPLQVANAVAAVDGIGKATVTLTWSPPWDQNLMSEDAKMALDIW
ncbi:MAG: DUF59 domain-containing protein [Alphaproteobacteria bacterium]